MLTGLVAALALIVVTTAAIGSVIVLRAVHGYGRVPDRAMRGRGVQDSRRLGTLA